MAAAFSPWKSPPVRNYKAILLDLDDTLLGNSMERFLPAYFGLLGTFAARFMPTERFLDELMACTRAAMTDLDPATTNRDVFWRVFRERNLDLCVDSLERELVGFYQDQFPSLREHTQARPAAVELVRTCQAAGLQVVVATNPIFPQLAIEHRLAWAGLGQLRFDLITTYDNMHSTKPHLSYYREILTMISCAPEAALMVGDDWNNDIEPALELGMGAWWIGADAPRPGLRGQGSLDDLLAAFT